MDWKGKRVAVTGAAGMIGSQVCRRLVEAGAYVTGLDNYERGRFRCQGSSLWIHERDVANPGTCLDFFEGADVVFHLAAKVTGIQYNRDHSLEMMQRNLEINWAVTEAVKLTVPDLYVFVSTACVYPHDAPVPTPESAGEVGNPEPTNWGYGVAKWVGEQQAKYLAKERGVQTLIVRFYNAFGPGDYYDEATSHVAPALIRRVLDGESPLTVWGSGNQTRVLVDCRDIAKALVMLAEPIVLQDEIFYQGHATVNIGHQCEISIGELARTIAALCGRPETPIVFDTSKPDGYARRAPVTTRLESLIGWVPDTPLEVTLRDMIDEYRAGKANV